MKLNPQQKKAIKHKKGPLLIIAGAGTGKTTVITEKVKYLIKKQKIAPQEILSLTFTEKAAKEMLERLDIVMPLGYEEPWLSTFHAFCDRILKAESLEIGLSPDYKILSQPDQWLLFKKHLFDFDLNYYRPLGNPNKFIGAILKFFSRLQDENISPSEFSRWVKSQISNLKSQIDEIQRLTELSKTYEQYQKLKLQENVLDFGDLISWTLKLFRQRPPVLQKYQKQFKHILVDEFQDTNFAQLQLIKVLAPAKNNPNLVVVGDDDQSIYKWRGAAVSNILDFKKHYPKAAEVVLTKNYRSGQKLLDRAYQLIQNNNPDRLEKKLKIDKKLVAQREEKLPEPQIFKLPTLERETEFVVEKILELVSKKPYTYKDFAILARANNHLGPFVATLRRHGIPYQLLGNRGLFDQEEVRDLIFFLKAVVDPKDETNLFQLLGMPILNIEPELILNLLSESRRTKKNLWEMVVKNNIPNLIKLVSQIKKARERAVKEPALRILYDFVQSSGYVKQFLKEESTENILKLKNLNLFFEKIKKFEAENKNSNLVEFVDFLESLIEAGENPAQAEIEDIDTVNLLTVHSAKGLEFPVVFLVNCVTGRFPTINRRDPIEFPEELIKETLPKGDSHIQEERRLFYVGATRAKDHLFVTFAKDYGGTRERTASGFLEELGLPVQKPDDLNMAHQLSWLEEAAKVPLPKPRIIKKGVDLKYISHSQIDVFKTCPLKYKYRYILSVPTKPHHALTFGQTIHETLRDFHLFEKKGKAADLDTLLYLYKSHFQIEGYQSAKHRQKRKKEGKKFLEKYFKVYKQKFLGVPKYLEQSFRLRIGNLPLIGKIDRIDQTSQGFELIDYKTGALKDQAKVDKDAQLTLYAMASKEVFGIEPERLSLYFIEANEKITTSRTKEQMEAKKEEIIKTIEGIKKSDFPARPNYPFPCGYCEYSQICPLAKKK